MCVSGLWLKQMPRYGMKLHVSMMSVDDSCVLLVS